MSFRSMSSCCSCPSNHDCVDDAGADACSDDDACVDVAAADVDGVTSPMMARCNM